MPEKGFGFWPQGRDSARRHFGGAPESELDKVEPGQVQAKQPAEPPRNDNEQKP